MYTLAIGDRAYSSWSLRGWLLFDAFGLPVTTRTARLYSDELPALLADFAPARTVPVMRTPDGTVVAESLAIAEELATRHPRPRSGPPTPPPAPRPACSPPKCTQVSPRCGPTAR